MPLPNLVTPTYELELPSTGQKLKYRPFLVKEEKILILAMESEDEKQIMNAIKTILKNCLHSSKVKVDELSTFDIEFLFLNIRARSIGEEIEVGITCPDDDETVVTVKINIDDIKVSKPENHSRDIELTDDVGLIMKYPSIDTFVKTNMGTGTQLDDVFEIACGCIEQIYEGENVQEATNYSKKELLAFLETLNTKQFMKLQEFFETMPKLSHKLTITNPNTGVDNEIVLEGLNSFFA